MCVCVMDIMNVLRTGMNMTISHIHVWLCYSDITFNSGLIPLGKVWYPLSFSSYKVNNTYSIYTLFTLYLDYI